MDFAINYDRKGVGKRINEVLNKLEGGNRSQFASRIGVTEGSVRNYESGNTIPKADLLVIICETYGVGLNWLLKGEGEMFIKDEQPQPKNSKPIEEVPGDYLADIEDYNKAKEMGLSLIPEYSDTFRAGWRGTTITTDAPTAYWSLPNVKADLIIEVEGDSMATTYPAGSKVAIREINFDRQHPTVGIPFGEAFGIIIDDGYGNYQNHLKRLRRHTDKNLQKKYWIAQSDNANYDDFDIDISQVRHLFIVVAVVKLTGF